MTINNQEVDFLSISRPDKIDQPTECTIVVQDNTGTAYYQKSQPVRVTDTNLGVVFEGVISQPTATRPYLGAPKEWSLQCKSKGDYRAGKRTSNKTYKNQYAGTVVVDMIQRDLASEGITANAALDWDELQTEWATGTHTNTIATTNISGGNPGGGDLELALAGSVVTINAQSSPDWNSGTHENTATVDGMLQPESTPAIKFEAECTLIEAGNLYSYVMISNNTHALSNNAYFIYDVFVDDSSPTGQMAADIVFTDGTSLRKDFVYRDAQNMSPHPNQDLVGLATGQWYHREFKLNNFNGSTVAYAMVATSGDKTGKYVAYFKNIRITDSSKITEFDIFSGTLDTSQQMMNRGYIGTSVKVVDTYSMPHYNAQGEGSGPWTSGWSQWTSPAYSISGVNLVQSGFLSYTANVPSGTLLHLKCSLNYPSSSFAARLCTNNANLSNLPAGLNVAGRSLVLFAQFFRDKDASTQASPEVCPKLERFAINLKPSYAMSGKTDVEFACTQASDWTQSGTTLTNVSSSFMMNKVLALTGYVNDFDKTLGTAELYSTGTASGTLSNRVATVTVTTGTDARVRLLSAGIYANFTLEVDIPIYSSHRTSIVYRTTNWGHENYSYAYAVGINATSLQLSKGTNSTGAGSFTQIGSDVVLTLTSGDWHRLKLVINGSSHKVYLDEILLIDATDGTYTSAGGFALRIYNNSGSTQTASFDNLGIVESLTGTWTSPNIALGTATTYGTSKITWRDQSQDTLNCTILVEATVNGGTNWYPCTNGEILPVLTAGQSLSGVNLKIRITLTTTTASSFPGIDNLVVVVQQQFLSSGTRISPALPLAAVGRAATALANWNAILPPGTSLLVQTDIGGGWQTVALAGGAISGISTQPAPIIDTFSTPGNYKPRAFGGPVPYGGYAQGNFGGGSGTWFRDITNRSLAGAGGTYGTFVYVTALTSADNQVIADFDECDGSGILTNYTVASSGYFVLIWDSAASGTPNTAKLYRRAISVNTQVGSTASITFRRGTYHRFVLDVQAGVLTVSMDGESIISYTDGSPLGSGKSGFVLNALLRAYSLRIQQYGQDVTALSLLVKLTLTSTSPIDTPQVLDLQAFVSSTDIGPGVLVPDTSYKRKYTDKNIDDLAKKSLYWSYIRYDNTVVFQARTATPAPFVVSTLNTISVGGQTLYEVMEPTELDNSGDSYRNRMIMQGAIATSAYIETLFGDGDRRSWNTAHPLSKPPTSITFNGQAVTFGIKNVDTGKQFYYQLNSTAIDQDSDQTLLQGPDSFVIIYTGTSSQDVIIDNTGQFPGTISQAQMAAIENAMGGSSSSGIVEAVIDASAMTVAEATTVANQELQRHGVAGRTFKFSTLHNGLLPGQQLPLFVSEYGLANAQLLVTEVDVTPDWANSVSGNIIYTWRVTATETANLGSWVKVLAGFLTK